MANKKFFDSIKKNANQEPNNESNEIKSLLITNLKNEDHEEDITKLIFSSGNLEDVPNIENEFNDIPHSLSKNKVESLEFNRDSGDDVLCLFNKELLLDNDDAEDNEEIASKLEEIPVFQKRGPKPAKVIEDLSANANIKEIKTIEQNNEKNIIEEKQKICIESLQNNIVLEVLNYVCDKTIEYMSKNYKSKMYTVEYTEKLFKEYTNKQTNSSNPLFKALIDECIEDKVIDPYLNSLTSTVLEYIKDKKI